MNKLCLVTGACGFMGAHMVELLKERGYAVRAADLPQAYAKSYLKELGVEFVPVDMTRAESLRPAVRDVSYVFHLAAIFSYSAPWSLLNSVNVEGTKNLLDCLAEVPSFQKIVIWGAGGIYRLPRGPQDLPITEASPIQPSNNYLETKWRQEQLVARFCREKKMRWSSVRGTTVYGPRAIYAGGQLILDAMRMKKFLVPRNFTFKIPTGHVRDMCGAALHVAEHPETDGEAYNVNDDSQTTTIEFLRMVAEEMGHPFHLLPPFPLKFFKTNLMMIAALGKLWHKIFKGGRPRLEMDSLRYFGRDFVYSNEKLKKAGYRFVYPDFRVGLKETIAWYKENKWV